MLNLRSATAPSDDDLMHWSIKHPGYRFEYINGDITIASPTGGHSGVRNSQLHRKLSSWADNHDYVQFGSSAGFVFGEMKVSPDEALVRAERYHALAAETQEQLVPLAPDVAVEIVSKSEEFGKSREELDIKCKKMFEQGVLYVLLLDPYTTIRTERVTDWGAAPSGFPTDWNDILDA